MPIVKSLLQRGCQVYFAGTEQQCAYAQASVEGLTLLTLEGYNVLYSQTGTGLMAKLLAQMPRLNQVIKREHQWLKDAIAEHGIQGVIADNRYGLNSKDIPTVMITHQLQPMSGMGSIVDNVIRPQHYKYLERFQDCWVVDVPNEGLAGKLSHPSELPNNATYVGLLSQLEVQQPQKEEHLLILLSGPEPQRSILEEKLWAQVQDHDGKVVFVAGTEDTETPDHIPGHITYHKRVTKEVLDQLVSDAQMVVSRSGYSTIMDLIKLGKKGIFIPTPGQTEQEYLAAVLLKQGVYYATGQKNIDLKKALQEASKFPYQRIDQLQAHAYTIYEQVLDEWLERL